MNRNPLAREWSFAAIVTLLFFCCALFNAYHHVMWRDEVRAWQIAAASPTLAALRQNLRYEGTPLLWYLIVWPLTKLGFTIFSMQAVHALIASAVVFLFAWRAPFNWLARLLFPFGYFSFFEYATLARSYSLIFLLLLAASAVICLARPRPILLAIVLFLLTQVSIWGAGFAAIMMLIALLHWRMQARTWWILPGIAVITGCALCYWQAIPGPGESFFIRWGEIPISQRLAMSVATIWKGWMPLPRWERAWWNTNVLDDWVGVEFALSILLLLIAILTLLRRPVALLLLVSALLGLIGFTYLRFIGATRHHGHLFMVLITSCWIAEYSAPWTPANARLRAASEWLDRRRATLLAILLCLHAMIGIGANFADHLMPFSGSKSVAEYITQKLPPDITLAGMDDYAMAGVSAYTGREFYYPQMRRFAPFNTQNDQERFPVTKADLFQQLKSLIDQKHADVLFVLNARRVLTPADMEVRFDSGDADRPIILRVSVLPAFTDSTVADESQALYLIHRVQ